MSRESFAFLYYKVTSIAKINTTCRKCIPLDKHIAIALCALGSSVEYMTIGRLFVVSKGSVCNISAVWKKLAPKYLPSRFLTQEKIEECIKGFEKIGFPQCLDAIDGCHIEIRPSASDAVDYYNYMC